MKKRDFIKIGVLGFAGLTITPSFLRANGVQGNRLRVPHVFRSFREIEDFFPSENLKKHYTKNYIETAQSLNRIVAEKKLSLPLIQVFSNPENYDNEILNISGEFFNHRLFWKTLSRTSHNKISDSLFHDINNSFGSIDKMKEEFLSSALILENTNGWTWVIQKKDRKLSIVNTLGNENPFFTSISSVKQGYPLFGLDLWQHAYINEYATIPAYIQAYFNTINWNYVSKRHKQNTVI